MLERYHFIGGEKLLSRTASPCRLEKFQGLIFNYFVLQLASHSDALMQVMTDTSAKRKSTCYLRNSNLFCIESIVQKPSIMFILK